MYEKLLRAISILAAAFVLAVPHSSAAFPNGFGSTIIHVVDLDRSVTFYTKILGMKLSEVRNPRERLMSASGDRNSNDPSLVLTAMPEGETALNHGNALGPLVFYVVDAKEVLRRAKDGGYVIAREIRENGPRASFDVKDPDGYTIHVLQLGASPAPSRK
jgi:lactoylglutathione lyase